MIAMAASVIPEMYREAFGDIYCPLFRDDYPAICQWGYRAHGNRFHWGYRHWLWFFMGFCLVIVQIVKIIAALVKHNESKQKA